MCYNIAINGNIKNNYNIHESYLQKILNIILDNSTIPYVKQCKFENGYIYKDTFEYFLTIEKHDSDVDNLYVELFISMFNLRINSINDTNISNVKIELYAK